MQSVPSMFTRCGPKGELSPTLGDLCPLCQHPLAVGDYTTLVRKTAEGRYANDGSEVHWDCAVRLVEVGRSA